MQLRLTDPNRLRPYAVLVLYVLVWTLAQSLAHANLDRYGDMLENYAWGQTFDWGSFKHPPLVGWVTGLWFRIFPQVDHFYYLLSYTAAALGLLGIYRLALVAGLGRLALAAVVLQMCALPYTTLAAKFNANTILLPLWPWVAYFWWVGIHQTRAALWPAFALGFVAALTMLGKYYSGVLLLSFGLLTLALPQGRRWLRTPAPWLALAVLAAALWPHLAWLQAHDFVTLRYVGEQGGSVVSWSQVLKFATAPLLYWGIALLVCVFVWGRGHWRWWQRLLLAWRPSGWGDALFWVAMLPFLITLLFGVSGFVELSLPWSIPLGFAFPLLWLRNLATVQDAAGEQKPLRLGRGLAILMTVVLVGAGVEGLRSASNGDEAVLIPRREAARAMLAQWAQQHPSQQPAWVGGEWAENAALAFYGDPSLRVIAGVPGEFPATLDTGFSAHWPQQPGLIYCPPVVRAPAAQPACERAARDWLAAHALPVQEISVDVSRAGWRFAQAPSYRYVGFMVLPQPR